MKKRLALYALAAAVLVVILLVLLAPALMDTPAVQAEMRNRASRALDGQVTWEALDVGLFPAPRAELRQVRVEIPGKIDAAAGEVKVHLRLWPLLRGSVQVSSVVLARPHIRITLEEDNSTPRDP